MKKFIQRILNNSGVIVLGSLVWFLLRTGTKPTRVIYPCQQAARANLAVFGLPAIAVFWQRFKKCPRYRARVVSFLFLIISTAVTFSVIINPIRTKFFNLFYYLKPISKHGSIFAQVKPRVVWIHNPEATSWDFSSSTYYWQYVDQNIIDQMLDSGLKALIGVNNARDAWASILPCGYSCSGKKIAVKVNFNNTNIGSWNQSIKRIDAMIQPVNALAKSLLEANIGITADNLWIYDATTVTNRGCLRRTFVNGSLYPLRFYNNDTSTHNCGGPYLNASYSSNTNGTITDVLKNTDYLINMPLMKRHAVGVSLSFKNHFGSVYSESTPWFHSPTAQGNMVGIQQNINSEIPTVLVIGDGLYGDSISNICNPVRWTTFGNDSPNSLFLAADQVAADSVMADLLQEETPYAPASDGVNGDCTKRAWGPSEPRQYLIDAEIAGLGVYEDGSPWQGSSGYSEIDLVRCEGICGQVTPPVTPTSSPIPTATPTSVPTITPTPIPCTANVDGQNGVNINDFRLVLANWGKTSGFGNTDINGDSKINSLDLVRVMKEWGKSCN